MDIATLVKTVISSFEDATSLVKRIKDRKDGEEAASLPEEPTRDLLDSLALGPVIVRGHFDHDLKRFGEPYACGDIQAREQMKDVLINLQMALMTHLRTVWMDDLELDFDALQSASDDCRVNAGVCLGQLSQRLSDAAKAQAMYPHNLMPYSTGGLLMPAMSPSLHYSSSRSTASSSTFSRAIPPRTPDSERFGAMSVSGSTIRGSQPGSYGGSYHGKWSPPQRTEYPPPMPSISQHFSQPRPSLPSDGDAQSMRRPSSHTLAPEDSQLLLSPTTYTPDSDNPQETPPQQSIQQPLPGAEDLDRASYVSYNRDSQNHNQNSPHLSRTSSNNQSLVGVHQQDRPGLQDRGASPVKADGGDYNQQVVHDTRPQMLESRPSTMSFSARSQAATITNNDNNYSTLEHVTYLQQNARPPVADMIRSQPTQQPQYPSTQMQNPSYPQQGMYNQTYPSQMQNRVYPQPSMQDISRSQTYPQLQYPQPPTQSQFHQPALAMTSAGRHIPGPGTPPQRVHSSDNTQTSQDDHNRLSLSGPILTDRTLSSTQMAPASQSTQSLPQPQIMPPVPPMRTASISTNNTVQSSIAPSAQVQSAPLILPGEKSLQGFCKGAQRLQVGQDKKAFDTARRPVGYSGMVEYWHCKGCSFEGPLVMSILPGAKKNKPDKGFDRKVRVSNTGIRYRWAFLAKCHVTIKSVPPEVSRDGSFGTFGCIFCCAEGGARGWHTNEKARLIEGTGARPGTPIFGNVQSFMEHLAETHRRRDGWPCQEMLARAKVVVGRVAEVGEEWDVNLTPA